MRYQIKKFAKIIFYLANRLGGIRNSRPKSVKLWWLRFLIPGVVAVLALIVFQGLFTKAEVADFYPVSCLGSWEGPEKAQGKPENFNLSSDLAPVFDKDNSAFSNGEGEIFCGSFIPPDYDQGGNIKNIGLTLIWDVKNVQSEIPIPVSGEGTTLTPEVPAAIESPGILPEKTESDTGKMPPGQSPEERPSRGSSGSGEGDTGVSPPAEEAAPPSSLNWLGISYALAEEVNQTSTDSRGGGLSGDLNNQTTTESLIPFEPEIYAPPLPPPDRNFLSISYSLDGQEWFELGRVSPENWKHVTIVLPSTSWTNLRNLQIRIRGLENTLDSKPEIYLDGILLEIHYDLPPILGIFENDKQFTQEPVKNVEVPDGTPLISLPESKKPAPVGKKTKDFGSSESPSFDFDLESLPETAPSPPPQSLRMLPRGTPIKALLVNESDPAKPSVLRKTGLVFMGVYKAFSNFFNFRERVEAQSDLPLGTRVVDQNTPIVTQVLDPAGRPVTISPLLLTINNKLRINLPEPERSLVPGKYKLKLWIFKDGNVYVTETDFTWGVLVINFNKSIYKVNDLAKFGIGAIDDYGQTICDAGLDLDITAPSGEIFNFSTSNGTINFGSECGPNTVTDEPDYFGELGVNQTGTYKIKLVAETRNGVREITDKFEVQKDPDFEVERIGASRIYPPAEYKFLIRVKANRDLKGKVREVVPESFEIKAGGNSIQEVRGGGRVIEWPIDIKKGETQEFSYFFDAPDISPELYKLGPFSLEPSFSGETWWEARRWQIAADAVLNDGSVLVYGDTADTDNLNQRVLTSTSTFASEGTTVDTGTGSDIKHVVIKAAPTRNEFVSGHLDYNGRLSFVRATSTTWENLFFVTTSSATQVCNATLGACNQTFDLAYEQLSGEALMVYGLSNNDGIIYYRTWDGNVTSSENSFTFSGSSVDTNWVRLVPRGARLTDQRSDEMLLLVEDGNSDLFAAIWDGSQFLSTTTITTVLDQANGRAFDGAWETNSGDAVVAFASGTLAGSPTTLFYYKRYIGGVWDATGTSVGSFGSTSGDAGNWVHMDADPLSNRIAAGFVYSSNESINLKDSEGIWKSDGSTAGWTIISTTSTLEAAAAFGQVQAAFERFGSGNSTSSALFTINVGAAADTPSYRTWISGTGFSATSAIPFIGATSNSNWEDDGNYRKLIPSPNDDEMMWVGVDSDNDLGSRLWTGSAWDTNALNRNLNTAVATGTEGNTTPFENNAFDFAYKPYSPWSLNWRWYNGTSTADTPTDALAAENTSSTISSSSMKLRLRFNVAERGGNGQTDARKKLQWTTSTSPNASSSAWTDVGNVGSSTTWRYYDVLSASSTGDDGFPLDSTVLSSSTVAGWFTINGTQTASSSMDQASTTIRELEYAFEGNSVPAGLTYSFRMYDVAQSSTVFRQQTSWPATPCAGNSVCTYPSILLLSPTPAISGVTVNGGNSMVLTANTTTTISVNYTLQDATGCSDVFTSGNTTTTLYRSGLASSCTADNLNCYRVSTSTHNCSGGTTANATSTFDIYYFADATDASSSYAAQNWLALTEARDGSSNIGTGTSSGVELLTLLAIDVVTSSLNYGTMSPSSTTGFVNQMAAVKDAGNSSSTIGLSGTALTQGSNSIATSSQHYASSTFLFGGNEGQLSGTATTISGVTLRPNISLVNDYGSWTNTTALPVGLVDSAAVAYKGYLYNLGGINASLAVTSTVNMATINLDGTIGAWSTTTALPSPLNQHTADVFGGYIYVVGGGTTAEATATATVRYAQINSGGTIGAWSNTTALPSTLFFHGSVINKGYLYAVGGRTADNEATATSTVLYAPISADGSVGAWSNTTALPTSTQRVGVFSNGDFVYVIGGNGSDAVATSTVLYASVNTNGSLGSWSITTALPKKVKNHITYYSGGYAYITGGNDDTEASTTTRYGQVNASGTVSSWTNGSLLTRATNDHAGAVYDGTFYVIGGHRGATCCSNITSSVFYANINNGRSRYDTFWGLTVPAGTVTGTFSGVNTFTAQFSP